jgi:multicomponent Na+:H+ antiporter subunit C
MTLMLAVIIGLLFATGAYMMLRRSFVKLIIGLGLLGHAANLLIITGAGVFSDITGARGTPPLIRIGDKALEPGSADPLPPALILTAIVISFAIVSFTIVLVKRTYQEVATDDLDQMRTTDIPEGEGS